MQWRLLTNTQRRDRACDIGSASKVKIPLPTIREASRSSAGQSSPGFSRLMEVLLFACRVCLVWLLFREIKIKRTSIGWIGTEPLTAYRTGIFAAPYAFAFLVCHYRPEAAFC